MRKYVFSIIVIAALCCFTAACTDESNRNEPEIKEWTEPEIASGDTLFYAYSVEAENVYSFPMLKTAAMRDVNLGCFMTCSVELPVPNKDFSMTISSRVKEFYPQNQDAGPNLAINSYNYGRKMDFGSKSLSNEWYSVEELQDKIVIHFKRIEYDSINRRAVDIMNFSTNPAPFVRHNADGKTYRLPASFWNDDFAGRMYQLSLEFIHIPDENIPLSTIQKYGCTYFPMRDVGQESSADEPDSAN